MKNHSVLLLQGHFEGSTKFLGQPVRKIWILRNFGSSCGPEIWFGPPFNMITMLIFKIDALRIPKWLLSRRLQ